MNSAAAVRMDHHLRRISALLWAVGIVVCLLVANSPLGQGYHRFAINMLALSALAALLAVWYFPWQRFNRDLFIVMVGAALIMVPLLINWSGGRASLFNGDYYFIIVFAALYFRRNLAVLVAWVTMVARVAPLLIGFVPHDGVRPLLPALIDCTTYLSIVWVARAMADEIVRLYGETLQRLVEREHVKRELLASEQRYRSLFEQNPDGVYSLDLDGTWLSANPALAPLIGYALPELLQMPVEKLLTPGSYERATEHFRRAVEGEAQNYEIGLQHKDGQQVDVNMTNVPIIVDGRIVGVYGIAKDVTQRKRAEEELQRARLELEKRVEERTVELSRANGRLSSELAERRLAEEALRESADSFDSLFRATHEGMAIHADGTMIVANAAFAAMIGHDPDTVAGRSILDFAAAESRATVLEHIQKGDTAPYEVVGLRQNGSRFVVEISDRAIRYQGRAARLTTFRDITERKGAEEQLRRHAFHDGLTGLPNRTMFVERLADIMERAQCQMEPHYTVLFLDLDCFKTINDSLGHAAGDQLLIEFARRLERSVRSADTVARFGGDEFTILLDGINQADGAVALAERIQQSLAAPIYLDGHTVFVTTSIGIALGTTTYQQVVDVLRDADLALYRAKALGKARHAIFDSSMTLSQA